jgi:ribonuclease HII
MINVGIDEVGRGPIAGPVSVCACAILNKKILRVFAKLKESKQMSEKKREEWFEILDIQKRKGNIDFVVSSISSRVIDNKGIIFSIKKALRDSLQGLNLHPQSIHVFLDGGLYAPLEYKNQKTIIKGDVKVKEIAMASVIAKVVRDRYMRKISRKYPQYSFDINKGYGTKKHYKSLANYGLSPIHRKSFIKKVTI